jgi:hypothetical protein
VLLDLTEIPDYDEFFRYASDHGVCPFCDDRLEPGLLVCPSCDKITGPDDDSVTDNDTWLRKIKWMLYTKGLILMEEIC